MAYQSNAEKSLHKLLIAKPFDSPVKVQVQDGRCRHDFFFQNEKLAIEIDGDWPWHSREANAKRDAGLVGTAILRLPWDMPAEKMREHIAHVLSETRLLPMPAKIAWVQDYHLQLFATWRAAKTAPPAKSGPNASCLDCGGSGWKMVAVWSEFLGHAVEKAARCECKNLRDESQLTLVSIDPLALLRAGFMRKSPQQETLFSPADILSA